MRALAGGVVRARRYVVLGLVAVVAALAGLVPADGLALPPTSVDLSTYLRVARIDLPTPLAYEASAVTYDPDTDTLFVVDDEGTSIVQVTKAGALVDSMTLAAGEFDDTEGLTYAGGGKFVVTEERVRQANLFTYVGGGTLHRSDVQTVKLGTTIGNIGIEGITRDPQTGGYVLVKEKDPRGIFQTGIDFAAGTATNGSPSTVNSVNLFDPGLTGLLDLSDVFALSNIPSLSGQPDSSHLLVISQESGKIIEVDRSGNLSAPLVIVGDAGNPLSVQDQTMEGVTMDNDGTLYVVNEQGGGPNRSQLWVYQHSSAPDQAPTGLTLTNQVNSLPENTSTASRLKVAGVALADDGLGVNDLSVSGPDAAFFEVDSTGLYIKAGTVLDFETKSSYDVTVNVNDAAVGGNPDATTTFHLSLMDLDPETPLSSFVKITEVAPWGSSNSNPDTIYRADWFEVTNTGPSPVSLSGWKMDDNSFSAGSAVALTGVPSLAPGESAIFFEGNSTCSNAGTIRASFSTVWFGSATPPAGLQIGCYGGSGVGLGQGGDGVMLFDGAVPVTGVNFGPSTNGVSFDNTAGIGGTSVPPPAISTLSIAGVNHAYTVGSGANAQTGSPDTVPPTLAPTVTPNPVLQFAPATANPNASDNGGSGIFSASCAAPDTSALGAYTVNCTATDRAGNTAAAPAAYTVYNANAKVWIGLKNSDDVGTRFDVKAVLTTAGFTATGIAGDVSGGSSGFNNARLVDVPLAYSGGPGAPTSLTVYARVSCASGHVSGTARLWYDDAAANSRVEDPPGVGTLHLRNGFLLNPAVGAGPKKTADVLVKKSGCPNQPDANWKLLGTWQLP